MHHTPLHTRPETITAYHHAAVALVESLRADLDAMLASNRAEYDAWPDRDERDFHLGERLDLESWTEHTTQQLRDLTYLLAIGDNGPTAAAKCDPENPSKQAHDDRRRKATERLEEADLLPR